jgi:hypothetical protein
VRAVASTAALQRAKAINDDVMIEVEAENQDELL